MAFSSLGDIFGKSKSNKDQEANYRISFAFCNLDEIAEDLLPKKCENVTELDLTENNLNGTSDLRFLMSFTNLRTLILDKNKIHSNFIIPYMENLTTLCVNHNKIGNLAIFVKNLCTSCPKLTYLSMLNNPAAPSYFNGGSAIEHKNYRLYVISRLRNLKMLDDKEISNEERSQAITVYGKLINNKGNKKSTKKVQLENNKLKASTNNIKEISEGENEIKNKKTEFQTDKMNIEENKLILDDLSLPNVSDTSNNNNLEDLLPTLPQFIPTTDPDNSNKSMNPTNTNSTSTNSSSSSSSSFSSSPSSSSSSDSPTASRKSPDYLMNLPALEAPLPPDFK